MDPALLRERELFKKRALSQPTVEKRPAASESGGSKKKKSKADKEASGSKHGSRNLLYCWLCVTSVAWVPACFYIPQ
uniref:Uncharacterized protein n=1 Tax=Hucho hucho TaxID=62062 RepID=A0A4W5JA94_9TELE